MTGHLYSNNNLSFHFISFPARSYHYTHQWALSAAHCFFPLDSNANPKVACFFDELIESGNVDGLDPREIYKNHDLRPIYS